MKLLPSILLLSLGFTVTGFSEPSLAEQRAIAEQGNPGAQYTLGFLYFEGSPDVPKDLKEAAKWFQKAAENGNASAQLSLSMMYVDGLGVQKNPAEAVRWLQAAAQQENAVAQYSLGVMYIEGLGVKRDPAIAAQPVSYTHLTLPTT
jgi:TPR repeat protein